MHKARRLIILLGVLGLCNSCAVLSGRFVSVKARGLGGDLNAAIDDGLRNAVEEANRSFLRSHAEVKGCSVITEHLLSRTGDFVHKYRVRRSEEVQDGAHVRLKAMVARERFENEWARLYKLMLKQPQPNVAVKLIVSCPDAEVADDFGYRMATKHVREAGFELVRDPALEGVDIQELRRLGEHGKPQEIAAILTGVEADVVMVGTVDLKYAETREVYSRDLCIFRCEASGLLIERANGKVIGTQEAQAQRDHPDRNKAAELAATDATQLIVGRITRSLTKWNLEHVRLGAD